MNHLFKVAAALAVMSAAAMPQLAFAGSGGKVPGNSLLKIQASGSAPSSSHAISIMNANGASACHSNGYTNSSLSHYGVQSMYNNTWFVASGQFDCTR